MPAVIVLYVKSVWDIIRGWFLRNSRASLLVKQPAAFATTRWSVVVRAGDSQSPEAAAAMERLCQTYWYPLYCFVRRKGHVHEDASDLTQAFFALFLEKRYLKSVDASLGKFRTFLLASMTHFLANEWDKSQTQQRGGGCQVLSLDDATAKERYGWNPWNTRRPRRFLSGAGRETVVSVVLDRLAAETEEKRFEVLKGFLLDDKGAVSYDGGGGPVGHDGGGGDLGHSSDARRFRALLVEEVANTVNTPEEVEPELRHLLASLSD